MDEYDDGIHTCDCSPSGIHSIPDGNCDYPSSCGTTPVMSCFMRASDLTSLEMCRFTRGQIGWGWWNKSPLLSPTSILYRDLTLRTFNSSAGMRLFAAGPGILSSGDVTVSSMDKDGMWATPYTITNTTTGMPVSLKNGETTNKLYLSYQELESGQISILSTYNGLGASSWLLDSETPFCATNIGGHALTIGTYGGGINPPATFFLAFHGKKCDSSDSEGLYIGLNTLGSTGDWSSTLISVNPSDMPIAPLSIITYYVTSQTNPYLIAYCKGSDETLGTPYMVTVDSGGYHLIRQIVNKANVKCESGKKLTLSKLDNVAGGRDTYYLSFPRTIASSTFINVLSNSNSASKATRWYRTRYDLPKVGSSDFKYSTAPFIDDYQSSATLLLMYSNATSGLFEISTSKGYF